MSLEFQKKIDELLTSLENVSKARSLYKAALKNARQKAQELSTISQHIINQPHIVLDDYEIDN